MMLGWRLYWYKLKLKKKKTVRIVTSGEFGEGGDRYGALRYEMIYKAGKVKLPATRIVIS